MKSMLTATTMTTAILTAAGADMVARAAESAAVARGVAPVIAVVDEGGMLITMRRIDGGQVASVNVAVDKARTAAIFRRPSKDFEDQTRSGRVAALALHGAVALQGGVPIIYAGQVVGAIGVSGASSADEDSELAMIGAQVATTFGEGLSEPAAATYLAAATVTAAFKKGGLLIDQPLYKVDAGRRSRPSGEGRSAPPAAVELHTWVTDVMYILEGTATLMTGGAMVDERMVAAGEYRAAALHDGVTHRLGQGDVFVIPNGLPHWFIEFTDPFLYYVVKVVQPH